MILLRSLFHFDIDEANLPVRREQVRARIAMYPTMLGSQLLLAPLLVSMMWGVVEHGLLLLWLAFAVGINGLELLQWARNRNRTESVEECLAWDASFKFFTLFASTI